MTRREKCGNHVTTLLNRLQNFQHYDDIRRGLNDVWKNKIQKTNTGAVGEDQEETDQTNLVAEGNYPGRSAFLAAEAVLAFRAYPSA